MAPKNNQGIMLPNIKIIINATEQILIIIVVSFFKYCYEQLLQKREHEIC